MQQQQYQHQHQQEGRGVINYSLHHPSHAFTTNTTEFDDALLSRGIITMEQAMLAKGASPEEACRLVALKHQSEKNESVRGNDENRPHEKNSSSSNGDADDEEEDQQEEEEERLFLETYRKKRLACYQNQSQSICIQPITRSEWHRNVNEASEDGTWVFVLLTSSCFQNHTMSDLCRYVEESLVPSLAVKYSREHEFQFVRIPSHHAISHDWPEDNLPTVFIYRYGILQHQLIGLKDFGFVMNRVTGAMELPSLQMFECILHRLGVLRLQNDYLELIQQESQTTMRLSSECCEIDPTSWGKFSGQMMALSTERTCCSHDDDDDYDEVD